MRLAALAVGEVNINNEILTVWKFDGYLEMFDWQLDGRWYNDDTTDTDVWVELASQLPHPIEGGACKSSS